MKILSYKNACFVMSLIIGLLNIFRIAHAENPIFFPENEKCFPSIEKQIREPFCKQYVEEATAAINDKRASYQYQSDYLRKRGYAYMVLQQFDLAVLDFDAAIKINPKNALAYFGSGEILLEKKDFKGAANKYAIAEEIDPHVWQFHSKLSLAKLQDGDASGAVKNLKAAIKLLPDEPNLKVQLANIYIMQKSIPLALAQLKEALVKSRNQAQRAEIAKTIAATKNLKKAK